MNFLSERNSVVVLLIRNDVDKHYVMVYLVAIYPITAKTSSIYPMTHVHAREKNAHLYTYACASFCLHAAGWLRTYT